ncbi:unnamed protein product [Brassica oleracea]|nr:unnamed protein product [Brassica napus]
MDDEWWNDCIHVIFEYHSPSLRTHPLTDLDRLDRLLEADTFQPMMATIQVLD